MFAPGVPSIMADFETSNKNVATFVVSVYVLGFAFGPLLAAPMSETYGRAICYNVANVFFIIFTVATALSVNMPMLIIFRFLMGFAGSTPITNGSGTISDMFPIEERGKAMAVWAMGPLLGPCVGPVAGGYVVESLGWRWVFWIIAIAVSIQPYRQAIDKTLTVIGRCHICSLLPLGYRDLSPYPFACQDSSAQERNGEQRPILCFRRRRIDGEATVRARHRPPAQDARNSPSHFHPRSLRGRRVWDPISAFQHFHIRLL